MAVSGSRVLLLGLAYKANTSDARESPSARIAELLLNLGAEVRGADPHVVNDICTDARLIRVEATVRLTIIRIIRDHLQDPAAPTTWCGRDLDFTGAIFDGGSFQGAAFTGGIVSF